MSVQYQVLAIKYAELHRVASENFADGRGGSSPMPMDYFFWVVRTRDRTIVVDTGFGAAQAELRGRTIVRPVEDGLAAAGVDPAQVSDVVLTHLHYDHAGRLDLFPRSRLHVHHRELEFVVGPSMLDPHTAGAYHVGDLGVLLEALHAGRVRLGGDSDVIAPGVVTEWVGGHTAGMQVVRIDNRVAPVVLMSDAAHFAANFEQDRPFAIVHDDRELRRAYGRLRELVDQGYRVVPGHDPSVMTQYPSPSAGLAGSVAELSPGHG